MVATTSRLPAADRRESILVAAAERFAARGYDATTLDEIAAAAGVTKPILYRHFGSKQDLYLALLARHAADMPGFVSPIPRCPDGRIDLGAILDPWLAYAQSKTANILFAVEAARRWATDGIAVNALRPVAAIKTPGWLASRSAEVLQTRAHRVSPPDSYVEAAILLAMQDVATCSGQELTDAQVLSRFGSEIDIERFGAMNAPVWSESLGRAQGDVR